MLTKLPRRPPHKNLAPSAEYAETWHADPATQHFLPGRLPEIHRVAGMPGMNFWSEEDLVTHSLHTVVIDREGQLAASLAGNAFSAAQLGDLLQSVMNEEVELRAMQPGVTTRVALTVKISRENQSFLALSCFFRHIDSVVVSLCRR